MHVQRGVGEDEEVLVLDGWWGANTWHFVVPGKCSLVVSLLHTTVLAVTAVAMFLYLRPSQTAALLQIVRHSIKFSGSNF